MPLSGLLFISVDTSPAAVKLLAEAFCLCAGLVAARVCQLGWSGRSACPRLHAVRVVYSMNSENSEIDEFWNIRNSRNVQGRCVACTFRLHEFRKFQKFPNWVIFGILGIWELRAPPNNSKYVFQISDVRGPLPLPKTPSQRSGLRTPACPAVPQRALIVWMALMASGIEVPQPRRSHLLSAILSAVMSLLCCWPAVGRIGLECCRSSKAKKTLQVFFILHVLDLSLRCPTASRSFGLPLPSRS